MISLTKSSRSTDDQEPTTILVVGVRRRCYRAAAELGKRVLLWSDGPLHEGRKKSLQGWLETPFEDCAQGLTEPVKTFLRAHPIERVLATTEASVVLGSRVRLFLGLETLAVDVTERFHDKVAMKNTARSAGIPVTGYAPIGPETTAEELVAKLGLPVVIKPVRESGASGVQVCRSMNEVERSKAVGLLAEAFVDGTEISVETFIADGKPLFHNCTEYLHQWKKSVVPARLDPDLRREILAMNDRVLNGFGVDRGVTHAEFYLTKDGPLFGEIAIRPPGGYYMELIERVYGFDPWRAYVRLSCGEDPGSLNPEPRGHAAVMTFHPDAGRLLAVVGEDEIRSQLGDIFKFRIKGRPGDLVGERTRTSNEVGHLLFWEPTRSALLEAIAMVEKTLRFEMEPFSEIKEEKGE